MTAAPLSLWEQDFSQVAAWLEERRAAGVEDFRRYFHDCPEEAIGLSGTIRSSARQAAELDAFREAAAPPTGGCACMVTDRDSFRLLLEQLVALAERRLGAGHEPITFVLQEPPRTFIVRMAPLPGSEQTLDRVVTAVIDVSGPAGAHRGLAASAEKYRRLFESACDAMVLADAATGLVVEVNRQAELLLELPAAMAVGLPLAKLLPLVEGDREGEGRPARCETIVTRHGSRDRVPVAVSRSRIACGGKSYVLGVVRELGQPCACDPDSGAETSCGDGGAVSRLTAREKEILRLIVAGNTSREIAQRLSLSPKTVETHRSRSMRKLNLHNTAALVRHVLFAGLE